MTRAEELLNKHLFNHGGHGFGIEDGNVYMAVLDAIQEALTIPNGMNLIAINEALPKKDEEVLTIAKDNTYKVMTFGDVGNNGFPDEVTHWCKKPKLYDKGKG